MRQTMHVGFDDTDSTRGGCTTYLAAVLVYKLERLQVRFIDYPNLIRLNPNVPWKTRGNGALCLRFEFDEEREDGIKKAIIDLIESNAEIGTKGTDPGIVFYKRRDIPEDVKAFAKKTETDIVTLKKATSLVTEFGAEAHGWNTRRGIIGALAAIGETLDGDHTFELIAYRTPENRESKRRVDTASIFAMDRQTQPFTFNNVDTEKRRVIITPRGPDPLLFGIRGETADFVKKAFSIVKPLEPVERWVIFRTNQGTDMHLTKARALNQLKPHQSVIARGTVSRNPRVVPLRHTVFTVKDQTAEVDCAAYEPTGELRRVARELTVGDEVEVYGAVRQAQGSRPLTINLEKINILSLAAKMAYRNPMCPSCGKSAESMGRGQGFRCKKCGAKLEAAAKVAVTQPRGVSLGLHFTSTRSQRHLTKPLTRYGQEKNGCRDVEMAKDWHS
jgi:tRNA(Ile2)-agmatinylcytidine synthase